MSLNNVTIKQKVFEVRVNQKVIRPVLTHQKIKIVTIAKQGLRGIQGLSGNSRAPINFAFGDATPTTIETLSERGLITEVTVIFRVGFDGNTPSVKIGIPGLPELLMAADHNAPNIISQFTTTPGADLPAGTQIMLTLNPGAGATQGSGTILFSITPIN